MATRKDREQVGYVKTPYEEEDWNQDQTFPQEMERNVDNQHQNRGEFPLPWANKTNKGI